MSILSKLSSSSPGSTLLWRPEDGETDEDDGLPILARYFPESEESNEQALSSIPPAKVRYSPFNFLFMGRRDQGKSMAMSLMADAQRIRHSKYGTPWRKIAANYKLEFADIRSPYLMQDIFEYPKWAWDLYLCIDEIQTAARARRSMGRQAINISDFLSMIRKRRIELDFTCQFPQQIDKDLLFQVDGFIEVEKLHQGRAIRLYIHDYWGQLTGNWKRRPWPPYKHEADRRIVVSGSDQVWELYDTDQVIASSYLDAEAQEIINQQEWAPEDLLEWQEGLSEVINEVQEGMRSAASAPSAEASLAEFPRRFRVAQYLPLAKQRGHVGTDATVEDLADWLKAQGMTIEQHGNQLWAIKGDH